MSESRAHVYISGTVQGVYFRANTRDQATDRGVTGWVKNLNDGRVEAVFEGPNAAVQDLIDWCHTGSPRASVDDVVVEWEAPAGNFTEFTIEY